MSATLHKTGKDRSATLLRRSKIDIIVNILATALEGTVKTNIMYKTNLGFAQVSQYLRYLLDLECLQVVDRDGRTTYKTTPKGVVVLQGYREIGHLLSETQTPNDIRHVETSRKEEESKNVSLHLVNDSINRIRSDLEELRKRVLKLESFNEKKQCPHCGNELWPSFKFCPYCGMHLQVPTKISQKEAT